MKALPALSWLSLLLIVGGHSFMDVLAEEDDVAQYSYQVVSKIRFDRENFTQGLEIHHNRLYVSSGLYGQSAIRIYDFPSMQLMQTVPVDARIFAEGLTIVDDHLYLLSWRERVMLIYALPDMTLVGRTPLPGQGWGATHDDQTLWFSDGSNRLYSTDVSDEGSGQIQTLPVTINGEPLRHLNELEWVNGQIWANVWQSDYIAQIDPNTGKVAGLINLSGLLSEEDELRDTDVLNGIAVDPQTEQIWVTGKRWPWLFEIVLEKADP
ncbi:glutaminyl-peptide cyclotransferase [Luminiphilus sp.]|nr:glutaminyl-peptide cyclotransferase [Luminiphilus sp.]MDC0411201.1 glutaminyl-peptide cyclotransferase [Luminiphilus sp.]